MFTDEKVRIVVSDINNVIWKGNYIGNICLQKLLLLK